MILFVLVLAALSANPSWHEYLHHDAQEQGHECAITLFAHGQLMSASTVPPVLLAIALLVWLTSIPQQSFLPAFHRRLPPSCGPPAFVS